MERITRNLIDKISEEIYSDLEMPHRKIPRVFLNGDKVCITGTPTYIVVIDKNKVEKTDDLQYLNLMAIEYGTGCLVEWTEDHIKGILSKHKTTEDNNEKTCPECNGDGVVEIVYRANNADKYGETSFSFEVECPICNGSGVISQEQTSHKASSFTLKECGYSYKFDSLKHVISVMKILGVERVSVENAGFGLVLRLMDGVRFVIGGYYINGDRNGIQIVE